MHPLPSRARQNLHISLAVVPLLLPRALSTSARVPIFDESRGVLTVGPMLEQATPAVVNIAVITQVAVEENPLLKDPFFRRYFGLPEKAPAPQQRRALAAGSGVIIDATKGLVVTNHHVIESAEYITVTFKDGRQIKAGLVGSDVATEVALLRVESKGLTGIPLADSDTLKARSRLHLPRLRRFGLAAPSR